MSNDPWFSRGWWMAPFLCLFGNGVWGQALAEGYEELTVAGLAFSAARGKQACFDAGHVDTCPFQLSIKLSAGKLTSAVANPGNLVDLQAGVAELMAAVESGELDDHEVNIRIPSTYYAPGKFRNVLIHNSLGRSITPEYCRGEFQPDSERNGLTGNVTLEKFTPKELEGTYDASLFKRIGKNPQGGFRCTEKPVTVSGRFRFSLPMLMDERFDVPIPEDDLLVAFGAAAWKGGDVAWTAGIPPGLETPDSSEATVRESLECACDCEVLASGNAEPACRSLCAARGVMCDAGSENDAAWSVDDAVRELEALGLPPASLGVMRQSLEQASPEERKMLIELYKQGLAGSGED